MPDLFETFFGYLQYGFVQRAFVVGILISLCASLLGVMLVFRRFSYLGDSLSHVAFGAMAIAAALNFSDDLLVMLPVTILCAVFLLRSGNGSLIKGDASIAMMSVGSLAMGYLLMNLFSKKANLSGDVCSTLFGSTSILTLSLLDTVLCASLSIVVILLFVIFYNQIFAVIFDETFAKASGIPVEAFNLFAAIVTATVIVFAMRLVGSLLVSALIIFPTVSAMRLFKSFRGVTLFAVVLSVLCTAIGIVIAILAGTPVGSTIVGINLVAFWACSVFRRVR
ncbi:MAG: metal ABC transporter permease [Fibrobacter sp.]|nr:metal ABC transporter permease [Fibrobacter sp.]MDY6370052.1 metal ABC transporter permease [Fibrobacter sp.]MDY6390871.1 metal ABC transporter permease [Fibrobacter sp.]